MANIKEKTHISNLYNGWTAETTLTVNGQDYRISTFKIDGGILLSHYMEVTINSNDTLSFNLFGSKKEDLISEKKRATEKNVREQHNRALLIFDEKINKNTQPEKQLPVIGSILFTVGYGYEKESVKNQHIVYEIETTDYGVVYYTVEKTSLQLDRKTYVKNVKDLFGIGTYFEVDYVFKGSQNELDNLVIEAHAKEKEERKAAESQALLDNQLRLAKIEEGKKILTIPNWAKCIIVAEKYEDDSDAQTDYFNTVVEQTYYLAFSKSTRNNMKELIKACANWEKTKELLEDETTVQHVDGHSYLPDYFIGSSSWSGLKVNKKKYIDLTDKKAKDILYIAAAEGRCFFPNQHNTVKTPINANTENITIIDYSEKAIAVIGNTKPLKEELKELGGRFNFRLSCGAGWIFSKKDEDKVRKFLKK